MKKLSLIFFISLCICCTAGICASAELKAIKSAGSGSGVPSLEVTFRAVKAPDLAGIKLVLHYDALKMQFKSFTKSKETQSMMHVVNDKIPGTLIIVMASATGRENPDFDLFVLGFERLASPDKITPLEIKVSGAEMMSAALSEIPCPAQTFRLE